MKPKNQPQQSKYSMVNNKIESNGKMPPQDIECEKCIIGTLIMFSQHYEIVSSILTSEMFYYDPHKLIYKAISQLKHSGKQVDLITVCNQLTENGELDLVGGRLNVIDISASHIYYGRLETHANIVRNHYGRRQIIEKCYEGMEEAYVEGTDAVELSRKLSFDLEKNSPVDLMNIKPIGEIAIDVFKDIELNISKNYEELIGLESSINEVNKVLNGYCEPDLIILGGRPGEGKTSFSLQESYNLAKKGKPVAYFCFEMSALQLARKLLSYEIKTSVLNIRNSKNLTDEQLKSAKYWADDMKNVPLYIYDVAGCNIGRLTSMIKDASRKYNIKMAFIDYLQLITEDEGWKGIREQEVSGISRKLKKCCKEVNIPIMVLAQLSREDKTQTVRLYKNSDFKESGGIEANADVTMFVMRPLAVHGVEEVQKIENKTFGMNDAMIIIGKNRQGETGVIHCEYYGEINTFCDVASLNQPIQEFSFTDRQLF